MRWKKVRLVGLVRLVRTWFWPGLDGKDKQLNRQERPQEGGCEQGVLVERGSSNRC